MVLRIGLFGMFGVGKFIFIEVFGLMFMDMGLKVVVLVVDLLLV